MRLLVFLLLLCLPGLAMAQKRQSASSKKPVKKSVSVTASKKKSTKKSTYSAAARRKRASRAPAVRKPAEAVQYERFVRLVRAKPWQDVTTMLRLAQPTVALRTKTGQPPAATGDSKLGGTPDLPAGLSWPEHNGQPLAFMAQLDLAPLARFDTAHLLPAQGTLYFFAWFHEAPAEAAPRDVEYKNAREYRVLYYEGPRQNLQRRNWPAALPATQRFAEARINATPVYGLPPWNDWRIEGLQLPERDLARLADFSSMYGVEEDHLLGYAYPLQDDPARDWAMAQLGLHYPLSPAQEQTMEARRREFVHLLTLELSPTFETVGSARALWGIRREDLIKRDFSKAVLVLQDVSAIVQRR
jgi:uncharacterized protein YwqG